MSIWDNRGAPWGTDQDNHWDWAPIGHTFELLESKACDAAYFLSLLESKGEDFLICADVHQDPPVSLVFPQLSQFSSTFLGGKQAWTPSFHLTSLAMDSAQVGKAVFER